MKTNSSRKKPNRHGVRAEGQTTLAVPMTKEFKAELQNLAAEDRRALAAWVRIQLEDAIRKARLSQRPELPKVG